MKGNLYFNQKSASQFAKKTLNTPTFTLLLLAHKNNKLSIQYFLINVNHNKKFKSHANDDHTFKTPSNKLLNYVLKLNTVTAD